MIAMLSSLIISSSLTSSTRHHSAYSLINSTEMFSVNNRCSPLVERRATTPQDRRTKM